MFKLKLLTGFGFSIVLASMAHADNYQITSQPGENPTGIAVDVPTNFVGTHNIKALSAAGQVTVDSATHGVSGQFVVPIDSLKSGNPKRDCHMREALGLDYSKSDFGLKDQHVCDNNNETPATGVNSIAYPNIQFEIVSVVPQVAPLTLTPGKSESVVLNGRWTIHNVTNDIQQISAVITTKADGAVSVKLDENLLLSSFKVRVLPALLVKVNDKVTLHLDLLFKKI